MENGINDLLNSSMIIFCLIKCKGVAQNHSMLCMDARQRLPGMKEGQVYTYPSKRWRKKRRQYLNNFMQPRYPPTVR